MENWERKFIVDKDGQTEIVEEEVKTLGPKVTVGRGENKRVVPSSDLKIKIQGKEMVWDDEQGKYVNKD